MRTFAGSSFTAVDLETTGLRLDRDQIAREGRAFRDRLEALGAVIWPEDESYTMFGPDEASRASFNTACTLRLSFSLSSSSTATAVRVCEPTGAVAQV